ncbi:MarR family winged helix-turn-helix transcriptional regulator [Actinokineospora sp. HUAS TT18]|uniref:MarR family winged helix-turn-helix transcriptional regulator n=1 Tax=Actinokineospora sp. HUAS TT18 TaxID=3447451 RepID=UPI003F52123A
MPEQHERDLAATLDLAAEALVGLYGVDSPPDFPRVSPPQMQVLLTVERRGPTRLTQLAADLDAIPSSASRLCDRLEAAGLVTRTTGEADRREVLMILTPAGHALIGEVRRARRERLAAVLAAMSAEGRAALLRGLAEFRDAREQA